MAGALPTALGVCAADPATKVVASSGDYDFQFILDELAVGAQFKLPYIRLLVNNSYLGLIRQSQRGFTMDYRVQLGFDNINTLDDESTAATDHLKVVKAWAATASACSSSKSWHRPSHRRRPG